MADLTWALSSCALILAVIAIRAVFGRRMRPGLRYALWGLVLLRLLVPVQLFAAPWGVAAALPEDMTEKNVYVFPMERIPVMDAGDFAGALQANPSIPIEKMDPNSFGYSRVSPDGTAIVRYADKWSVSDILRGVWLVGIGVTAAVFLVSNARFYARLRKRRRLLETDGPLRVYAVENLSSSCLFGNAVYAAAETAEDGARLRHVLAHELSHYRHGDHVWTLLRCAALALHWYNPLVWWAAALSRQDSELCADAGALRRLGEAEREDYGATLIELSARHAPRAPLLCTATTMTNGKRPLRERVTMIARRPRMTAAVVIAVLLIAAVAAGCAFAGEKEQREFPMDGSNVSALDTDRILTQISTAEKLEDPSALCVNADQFEVDLTPEFDWANDGAIRYFYTKDRKTYGAQLRVFADNNTFFITESQPWPEQSRFYKLEHYLDALKYLPQEEIRLLSQDADQYIVRFAEDGVPEDFERAVCYSANGAAELDGWYIHLVALPEHGENGGYHGSGDEAIHLFYGEQVSGKAAGGTDEITAHRVTGEMFGLSGRDAALYTAAADYLGAGVGNGCLMLPVLTVYGDYADADGNTCYICGLLRCYWWEFDPADGSCASVGAAGNPACFTVSPEGRVIDLQETRDGEDNTERIRELCGPRADIAALLSADGAAAENLPDSRVLGFKDHGEMLARYLPWLRSSAGAVPIDEGAFTFASLEGEYWFLSGAGGWKTQMLIEADGSFMGSHRDADAGVTYLCDFYGRFGDARQIDDYTCSVRLLELGARQTEGEELGVMDGVRCVGSSPYGIEGADEVLVYLPGAPVSALPEDFLQWYCAALPYGREQLGDVLPTVGLFNVAERYGWFEVSPPLDGTPLTDGELAAWREELSTMREEKLNPVSCFFTSTYADPRGLDLAEFLAYCPVAEDVEDEAEFEKLVGKSPWEEYIRSEDGGTRRRTLSDMPVPVHRYRVSRINDVLTRYAGITLDDLTTDWRHDGRTIYLPEYDAFYNFTSDSAPGMFYPRYGARDGDVVTLYEGVARGSVLKLRLMPDGGYRILSHLPNEALS